MRKILLLSALLITFFYSCKTDDNVSCVICSNSQTLDFIVCNEANGNASVNGEDTGQSYSVYIANLHEQEDTTCN